MIEGLLLVVAVLLVAALVAIGWRQDHPR